MGIELFYRVLIVIGGYLFGAIPTAYILYKIKRGDDIRKYGSGNVGGTNVARTLGAGYGALTIVLDMIKGFIPILILYFIYPADLILLSILSIAVVLGHDFPVYIKFKGGKGIATSYGMIAGITLIPFEGIAKSVTWIKILPLIVIIGIWVIIFLAFRISSVASLCGALATPISFFLTGYALPIVIASVCWCILIFITHRENIKRLIRKEEKKLSGKEKT